MKKTLFEYYRVSAIAFIVMILVTPMLFLLTAYGTILYKFLRLVVLWLY